MLSFPAMALVRRELLTTLRRRRAAVVLVGLTLAAAFLLLADWPDAQEIMMTGASVSREFVDRLFMAAVLGAAVVVPGLAGTAIVSEREQDSFDQLHCTLITPSGILRGKLVNVVGFYALLFVSLLPILGITFFLVGIGWLELFVKIVALFASVIACGAVGLWCSARFQRPIVAIACAYVGMICVYGLPFHAVVAFSGVVFGYSTFTAAASLLFQLFTVLPLITVSPVDYLPRAGFNMSAVYAFGRFDFSSQMLGPTTLTYLMAAIIFLRILIQLLIAKYALRAAQRILHKPPRPRVVKQEVIIDDVALLELRRTTYPYYLFDPCRRRPHIEDGRNPMLVKEFRWGFLGQMSTLVRTTYGLAFLYVFGFMSVGVVTGAVKDAAYIITGMPVQIALVCLAAPALLGNLFTKEREQGNMDMLRMTLLRPRDIVAGKLSSGFITMSPFIAATLITIMVAYLASFFIRITDITYSQVLGLTTILVCTAFSVAMALAISLHARQTANAILGAYAVNLLVLAGFEMGRSWLWSSVAVMARGPERLRMAGGRLAEFLQNSELLCPLRLYVNAAREADWTSPETVLWLKSMLLFGLAAYLAYRYTRFVYARRFARDR